ncbi:MAG: nucleotidyltransferase domain-containing protein [Dysgonamonadaceae bacterium]|jgi:predicted nucleotidyltransferase|nr:nucleotidyltransferase domain-containing protein [Dysgonamonadaceae bacterium]
MDEKQDIIGKVKDYSALVRQSRFPMQIDHVYLFGSYAKGNPHKDSDIDVAFVVKDWNGEFFDVMPLILKLTETVDMRIEPHVIVPQEDYAGFLDEIQRTGILID